MTEEFNPLIATLVQAQLSMTHDVNSRLIENLMYEVNKLRATNKAIIVGVLERFNGPYAPSQHSIITALYPSAEFVQHFIDRDPLSYYKLE